MYINRILSECKETMETRNVGGSFVLSSFIYYVCNVHFKLESLIFVVNILNLLSCKKIPIDLSKHKNREKHDKTLNLK